MPCPVLAAAEGGRRAASLWSRVGELEATNAASAEALHRSQQVNVAGVRLDEAPHRHKAMNCATLSCRRSCISILIRQAKSCPVVLQALAAEQMTRADEQQERRLRQQQDKQQLWQQQQQQRKQPPQSTPQPLLMWTPASDAGLTPTSLGSTSLAAVCASQQVLRILCC